MPELPDIAIYVECLEARIASATLKSIRLSDPFLLRTAVPRTKPITAPAASPAAGFSPIARCPDW